MSSAVAAHQRWSRDRPCPICGGAEQDPRGKGRRCIGYRSSDGKVARCSREEYAGQLDQDASGCYPHWLSGPCDCGTEHGPSEFRPDKPPLAVHQGGKAPPERRQPLPVTSWREVGRWQYRRADKSVAFEVVREDAMDAQGTPIVGANGKREKRVRPCVPGKGLGLHGEARILYGIPEVLASPKDAIVFVVEGEKCAEALRGCGLVATTAVGGAGQAAVAWRTPGHADPLRGRRVVVLPDNDDDGEKAASIALESIRSVAEAAVVLRLDSLKPAGDVVDWLDSGHTAAELGELASAALRPELAKTREGYLSEILPQVLEDLVKPREPGQVGLQTGIRSLDNIAAPRTKEIYVIGAPTGIGKTSMAMQILLMAAMFENLPGIMFSVEQARFELARRLLARWSGVSLKSMTDRSFDLDAFTRMRRASQELVGAAPVALHEDDEIDSILATARRFGEREAKGGAFVVVMDYVQDLKVTGPRSSKNGWENLKTIMADIRKFAIEHNAIVILPSQVKENFVGEVATKEDLANGSAVSKAASVVLTVNPTDDRDRYRLYVSKNRNGMRDVSVDARWNGGTFLLEDWRG